MSKKNPSLNDICILITKDSAYAFKLRDQQKLIHTVDIPPGALFINLTFAVENSEERFFKLQ